ncbi:MAG: hypothetical protein H7178_11340 [Chitinophagaceae bacterium]|nr:hypothetical protein [Chitinophagaceae bacterium]
MDTIELVEQFKVILLNRANKVLGLAEISSGGITCVTIDISLVFAVAKATAPSLCFHLQNHMDAIFIGIISLISVGENTNGGGRYFL